MECVGVHNVEKFRMPVVTQSTMSDNLMNGCNSEGTEYRYHVDVVYPAVFTYTK